MKKLIFIMMAFVAAISIGLSSCNSCNGEKPADADTAVVNEPIVVENTVTTDRETMFLHYDKNYRWYETQILTKDYLDADTTMEIESVTNVFQVIRESPDSTSADAYAVLFTHTNTGDSIDIKEGLWIEDQVLNEEAIKVTFLEAYEKMMQANCVKPHSRHCILRKQVAPYDANAQYIFGNTVTQVYVDAVTGNVSMENPAFTPTK